MTRMIAMEKTPAPPTPAIALPVKKTASVFACEVTRAPTDSMIVDIKIVFLAEKI